jgi:hypothetical protein
MTARQRTALLLSFAVKLLWGVGRFAATHQRERRGSSSARASRQLDVAGVAAARQRMVARRRGASAAWRCGAARRRATAWRRRAARWCGAAQRCAVLLLYPAELLSMDSPSRIAMACWRHQH